ncbi:glycerate kinase family protein [Falsibacillus pallidus]|uniref:glycerate kinase family protein n=1 Tax=Falsibacillus pallidus TaxID=493781 RepID=UPI003D962E2C
MNVLIASDTFKGSLSSYEVGKAAETAIKKVIPEAKTIISPMADGGEGTIEALLQSADGHEVEVDVHDPLMRPIKVKYAVIHQGDRDVAYIECARSSGLSLLPKSLQNPTNTNTYGLGEQIKDAIKRGYRDIVISLGGSATNDGGLGMLQALGWHLYDASGTLMGMRGNPILEAVSLSEENIIPELKDCRITAASDVTCPFYGERGAAYVFAKQKGASDVEIGELDLAMRKLANLYERNYGKDVQNIPGSGAAGGLGGAISAALKGEIKFGVDQVIELTCLEDKIKEADLIITGEGSIDYQSLMGKVPLGVGKLAKKHNKKVIAIAGRIDAELTLHNHFLDGIFSIQTECRTLEEALDPTITKQQVETTVEQLIRLLK